MAIHCMTQLHQSHLLLWLTINLVHETFLELHPFFRTQYHMFKTVGEKKSITKIHKNVMACQTCLMQAIITSPTIIDFCGTPSSINEYFRVTFSKTQIFNSLIYLKSYNASNDIVPRTWKSQVS